MKIVFDMETGDPDDFLTLIFLLGHPRVDLRAVTLTPGTKGQVGLVRWALNKFNRDIPVGAFDINHKKDCVSKWHYTTFGNIPESSDAENGSVVLERCCDNETTLITGAPLKNLGEAVERGEIKIKTLVAQGGFAGEGVVPQEKQLEKFKGMKFCPTYNLNGAPVHAENVLKYSGIAEKYFVSKNICHGVVYDKALHDMLGSVKGGSASLELIHEAMEYYVNGFGKEKKLHDPLAACCAIDRDIGEWVDVKLYRVKGQWGSEISANPNCKIIVDYDEGKFYKTFMEK